MVTKLENWLDSHTWWPPNGSRNLTGSKELMISRKPIDYCLQHWCLSPSADPGTDFLCNKETNFLHLFYGEWGSYTQKVLHPHCLTSQLLIEFVFPILFTRDVNVILRIPLTFDSFFADITRFLGTLIIVLTKTHRSELSHHDIAIRWV